MKILKSIWYKIYYPLRDIWRWFARWTSNLFMLGFCFTAAFICRHRKKRFDVGLGPLPLINNVYHKRALKKYGYTAKTFCNEVFFINDDYDYIASRSLPKFLAKKFIYGSLFLHTIRNYRCIYIYFNGGILGFHPFLWRFEARLYKIARVKTVVTGYGADVHDMTRSPNLLFKNAMSHDYPKHRFSRKSIIRSVDLWSLKADHIISGNDWVDYLYHWDTLMIAHFSIDTEQWKPAETVPPELQGENRPLRIFHAPNHKTIKGSKHFIRAVEELKNEGLNIELVMLQKVPNHVIRETILTVDVVADQIIMGWYAMFALEAMSMGKPVICSVLPAYEELFIEEGLLEPGELPLIRCTHLTVKETIRDLYNRRAELPEIGRRSREYVQKHHSLEYVGSVFDKINRSIGISPSQSPES
ncbi:MAG: DedA family protein [Bacteroidetes bacterium]|nr:MAG: DedA family protein [Bacteroidota bacterium]